MATTGALRRDTKTAKGAKTTRSTVLPRYREIGNQLMADIADSVYPVGSFLPAELELCERYEISRFTAREALRQLINAGLVTRRQGSGTQVVAVPGAPRFTQQARAISDLLQYAQTTQLRLVYTGKVALNRMLARQFRAKPGEEWIFAAGIRMDKSNDDAPPICVTRLYLNPVLEGVQEHLRQRDGAIYEAIEQRYKLTIQRVEQQISAVVLDRDDAVTLNEPRGAPALRVMRFYYDGQDRLLEVSDNVHPADRFVYGMVLRREGGG